jgi:hypothetical protein
MSMNLNVRFDNIKYDLWQTPTQISYMCIIQSDGNYPEKLTGNKAKQALQIYKVWVLHALNGLWNGTPEQYDDKSLAIEEEISRLDILIKKSKKIEVWVM